MRAVRGERYFELTPPSKQRICCGILRSWKTFFVLLFDISLDFRDIWPRPCLGTYPNQLRTWNKHRSREPTSNSTWITWININRQEWSWTIHLIYWSALVFNIMSVGKKQFESQFQGSFCNMTNLVSNISEFVFDSKWIVKKRLYT